MSYVYFLERHLGGLIKIGYSRNPVSRLRNHRLIFGRMNLLGVIPGGRSEEAVIHGRFCHLQLPGHKSTKRQHMQEFFRPAPELLQFIKEEVQWLSICEEANLELVRHMRPTRASGRAENVLGAIYEGFDFEDIATAYDVPISSVYFVYENRHRIAFCSI